MVQSFKYAFAGVKDAFKSEPSLRIHFLAAFLACNLAYSLGFNAIEWAILTIAITLVIVMELVNTIVEKLVDVVSPQRSEKARVIKDISAAMVLFTAISSVVVGVLLFLPKVMSLS